jgi:hypothetical protein
VNAALSAEKSNNNQTVTYSKSECIPPLKENIRTSRDVEVMFNSHIWKLDRAKAQDGDTGVLIRMTCDRCGADKIAILKEDNE